MLFGLFAISFGVAAFVTAVPVNDNPPVFATTYQAEGLLQLPYAELEEPVMIYFDAPNKRSRIDYYTGIVSTIARGDKLKYGTSYKLAPMSNYKVMNQRSCFQTNGTENSTIGVQSFLPDLTGFKLIGEIEYRAIICNKWQMVEEHGYKKNTYTMLVNKDDNTPVQYEMFGYDTLLGSHYDKYYIDYLMYRPNTQIPESVFEIQANLTCTGFPGPGSKKENVILMNPMAEYINKMDEHHDELFDNFKNMHNKKYPTSEEHAQRKHIFRQNVRYIHSKNRAGLTYTMAINHLADKSDDEMKKMRGYRYTPGDHGAIPFDISDYNLEDVPDSHDWRLYGAVTPVKDQAVCGSCWSFGTAETIEGRYFLKTGYLVRLSQQELMDCSWGEGNNGCDGGEDFRSYDWVMKNGGLTSEDQYGAYMAIDGYCHSDKVTPVAKLTGYVNVTSFDLVALKVAIFKEGPISVAIDASHKSLSYYANGVYYEPKCGNKPDQLDHAVLAVGYGVMKDQPYWLIKNSWSTHWGNDGYVLMSQKDNNCGVATAATYTLM